MKSLRDSVNVLNKGHTFISFYKGQLERGSNNECSEWCFVAQEIRDIISKLLLELSDKTSLNLG